MDLPEACIAHVLSFTSPPDACRLSLVSPTFRSAADSDALWDSFLPPDCLSIRSRSPHPPPFSCKKHLYLSLSDHPLLIDDGLKSYWLDKLCGAKCFMLSARSLSIVWGDTPEYWTWTWVPESSGTKYLAGLRRLPNFYLCWLEIRGRINSHMLSPSTLYAAYLVFNFTDRTSGFKNLPVEVSVGITGNDGDNAHERTVYLDPNTPKKLDLQYYPNKRADGWLEIELGEFFNHGGYDEKLEMAACQFKIGHWKRGLVIEGLEIRPKHNN